MLMRVSHNRTQKPQELVDNNEAHFADAGGFVSPSGISYIGVSKQKLGEVSLTQMWLTIAGAAHEVMVLKHVLRTCNNFMGRATHRLGLGVLGLHKCGKHHIRAQGRVPRPNIHSTRTPDTPGASDNHIQMRHCPSPAHKLTGRRLRREAHQPGHARGQERAARWR